jgi:hypothetical protein
MELMVSIQKFRDQCRQGLPWNNKGSLHGKVEVKTRKPCIVETWALAYGGNRLGDGFLIKLDCANKGKC